MTAVEQFWKEISEIIPCKVDSVTALKVYDKLKEAKEMENEQMEITWNNAIDAQLKDKWDSYDDFYKTTFKSE